MYTQSVVAAIVAGLLSTATAAPLTVGSNNSFNTSSSSTSSTDLATASASSSSGSSFTGPVLRVADPMATVLPEFTSQFNTKTGAIDFNTPNGQVSRSPKNGGADITTLVTFTLDPKFSQRQCQLVFDLENPASSLSGTSNKAQLFTSLAPATADSSTFPPGNLRNQFLATIDLVLGGRASFEAGSGPAATNNGAFACSDIAGQMYGAEVAPQGDDVSISWLAGQDGPKIIVW